jgi:cyclic beta-1,2-glucan synthetase
MHQHSSAGSGTTLLVQSILYAAAACAIAAAGMVVQTAGGSAYPPAAALLAVLASGIIKYGVTRSQLTPAEAIQDGLVVGLLALSSDPAMEVWQAPAAWHELFSMTSPVAGIAAIVYLVLVAASLKRTGRHLSPAAGCSVILAPCFFNCLLLLQSPVMLQQIGRFILSGAPAAAESLQWLGTAVVLVAVNEAVALGLNVLRTGRLLTDRRLHLLLTLSAVLASVTPYIARWGSSAQVAALPPVAREAVAIAAAMLSQAGLWAQIFLLTGLIMDALNAKHPLWYWGSGHFSGGFIKGAVYSLVFMGLIHSIAGLIALPSARAWLAAYPLLSACVFGAAAFPLLKTVIESFDGDNHFFQRLHTSYADCTCFLRGAAVGAAVAIALQSGVPAAGGGSRWLYGFAAGAGAYALVDLLRDTLHVTVLGKRLRLQSWRVYAVEAALGGLAGGALAWYVDLLQAEVITAKFKNYAALLYAAQGIPVKEYVVYPLFSKWGAMNLGMVDGGVSLLFKETLSGVINWSIAAPLFSVNLVLLNALLQRSTVPLRHLFTRGGLVEVAEQAFRVQRWGLWMAPIIYSFLRMAPDPTWYNQDGAIRTAVATVKGFATSPEAFRAWSLQTFVNLLAFDWLRIAIFIDHMGLRVATLVNLSFVGVDIVDEKTARFLGHSARTRVIAEGLRRFVTWAPLLLPFYLPRGSDWDYAWSQAATMSAAHNGALLSPGLVATAFLAVAFVAGAVMAGRRIRQEHGGVNRRTAAVGRSGSALMNDPLVIGNGLYTLTVTPDGRGWSRVFSSVNRGRELDITRQSPDPVDPCGKFIFLADAEMPAGAPGRIWSLCAQPVLQSGQEHAVVKRDRESLEMRSVCNGIRAEAIVRIDPRLPLELWTVRLFNSGGRSRTIDLTSYREFVLNAPDAYLRHFDYNSLHIGTWFVSSLSAVIAQNRLLKNSAGGRSAGRLSPEVAFHAVRAGNGAPVRLTGYEDSRAYFIGGSTLRRPQGLERSLRDPADEGLLYTFDPCACLRLRVSLPPGGTAELMFADGYASAMSRAASMISNALGMPAAAPGSLQATLAKKRVLHGFAAPEQRDNAAATSPRAHLVTGSRFSFSADGTELRTGWNTSRPWAHVLANQCGYGAIVTNQGDIFSFMGNAQQNGLTPFSTISLPVQVPGQALYVHDIASGGGDDPVFVPFNRTDESAAVTYGRGSAVFRTSSRDADMELAISILPDEPAEVRVLRISNRTGVSRTYRIVPYLQMVLGEIPDDTRGTIKASYDEDLKALFFANDRNDFQRGFAFVATNLEVQAYETVRSRFIGGPGRDLTSPYMVEHGRADETMPDDGYAIASFVNTLTVPAHGQGTAVLMVGCCPDRAQAERIIRAHCDRQASQSVQAKTNQWWSDLLSVLRIETTDPAFDRLVNGWLPYQVLAAHLWGRTGPNQRSGAYGFRDQLQSALPLLYLHPEISREHILLHGAQQFYQGDVMQWWHQSWEGRTGLGVRNRTADPHLWLPYLVYRYVDATGDLSILQEQVRFLEGMPIPRRADGIAFAPRRSRDSASLYRHCMRAIDLTLRRFGAHGLPLMLNGDWNDGLNQVGRRGRGESTWLGFFLYDILTHFSRLIDLMDGHAKKERYGEQAARLKESLNQLMRDGRYPRAIDDDGRPLFFSDALSAAWPVISGVADFARGARNLERTLEDLEVDHLVRLLYPPFEEGGAINPGKIADYPPGVRENGAQYSHGASWLVDALVRLAEMAAEAGDREREQRYRGKAVDLWMKISPIAHTTADVIDCYGMPPHQQPADIYCGYGYDGRGGWSWYTGAAARMLWGAYALLGLKMKDGMLAIPDNLFEPRGTLQVKRLIYKGAECVAGSVENVQAERGPGTVLPLRSKK